MLPLALALVAVSGLAFFKSSRRENTLLEELPLEIWPRILRHLDSYSLRQLLLTSPRVREICVVLYPKKTDHRDGPYLFHSCPGLLTMHAEDFDPAIHRKLFKIYEMGMSAEYHYTENYIGRQLPYVHPSDSFVHCFSYVDSKCKPSRYHESFLFEYHQETLRDLGVSFQMDLSHEPYHFFDSYRWFKLYSMFGVERLHHVRIDNCQTLQGIAFPHNLSSLSLSFTNPPSGERPLLKNCTIKVSRHLSLYYEDQPPILENVTVTRGRWTTLTVCHSPSLRGDVSGPFDIPSCDPSEVDFGALNANGVFANVCVIGGHDCIVQQLYNYRLDQLVWKQTCRQSHPVLDLGQSIGSCYPPTINFETFLHNALLPRFDASYTSDIHIVSHNGLVMSEIVLADNLHVLKAFSIHCYQPLVDMSASRTTREAIEIPKVADVTPLMHTRTLSRIQCLSVRGLKEGTELSEESWWAMKRAGCRPGRCASVRDMIP